VQRPLRLHALILLAGWAILSSTAAQAFQDPSELPATPSALATHSPLLAVTRAGARIVAVGQRGHIVLSDDQGQTWRQAEVPVSVDLVAVSFPTPQHGWAVGHGGVILHSADGGEHWVRQLDGHAASEIALRHYRAQAAADPAAAPLVEREEILAADSGTQPFMDVYFESDTTGFVVGTFNRIFRTGDGGKTWEPWMDRTDNEGELHFYAVRGLGDQLYLAGEQGMVWRLNAATQRFEAVPTPYQGTLFGLAFDGAQQLLAYGMRGSLFRSTDQGQSWTQVTTAGSTGITGGTKLPDGDILLANISGELKLSRDGGRTFAPAKAARPMPYYGAAALDGHRVALVGAQGVRIESFPPQPAQQR
jgi:photosystem II stability/assembly factor-like uncharacterized protein